jgi:cell division protein FtsN
VAKPEVKAKDVKAKAPVAVKAAPVAKKAPEVAKPKPVSPVAGSYFVQGRSFFRPAPRADALAQKLGGIVSAQSSSGLFRVRIGPLPTKAEADQKLAAVQKNGHPTARIYRE